MAIHTWGHLWQGKQLHIYSDNMASVAICSRGYTHSPALAKLMRQLFWVALSHDIDLKFFHIAGVTNILADHLSQQTPPPSRNSLKREKFVCWKHEKPAHDAPTAMVSISSSNWPTSSALMQMCRPTSSSAILSPCLWSG